MKQHFSAAVIWIACIMLTLTTKVIAADEESNPWSYANDDQGPVASDILLPLASFVLPGAGQWARAQLTYGAAYSGVAVAGIMYATNASRDVQESELMNQDLTTKNTALRKYILGLQTTQSMGGLSLYHTFRSAVWQRQKYGQYGFLGKGDHPSDILLAPLHFQYLTRPSTWIPLTIATAIASYAATHPADGYHRVGLKPADYTFASGFSYNAGTHEEALFRGWLMPLVYESGLSTGISNLVQSSVFALAHLGSTGIPLPQFLLGLHLGNVTTRNNWHLGESIFIHVWWDVIAFTGNYYLEKNKLSTGTISNPKDRLGVRALPFIFPPMQFRF